MELTAIFKMRPCIMGECLNRHFAVRFFLALVWKFLTKYDNVNSIFHYDKISADNKV